MAEHNSMRPGTSGSTGRRASGTAGTTFLPGAVRGPYQAIL